MKKSILAIFLSIMFLAVSAYSLTGCDFFSIDGLKTVGDLTYERYFNGDLDGYQVISCSEEATGEIVIPDKLRNSRKVYRILEGAFQGCENVTSITLGKNINWILDGAFKGCHNLAELIVPEDNPVYKSDGNCIFDKKDNKLLFGCKGSIIPEYVTEIGTATTSAFEDSGITEIFIHANITYIGSYSFFNCSKLESIEVDSNNTKYWSENNCLMTLKDDFYLTVVLGCKNSIIPEYTQVIGFGAFYGSEITSITLPKSVAGIDMVAFSGCKNLTDVILEDETQMYALGVGAFSGCEKLSNFIMPRSITFIGDFVFANCISLMSITVPDGVTIMGPEVFMGWTGAQTIYIQRTSAGSGWYSDWNANCNAVIVWEGTLQI